MQILFAAGPAGAICYARASLRIGSATYPQPARPFRMLTPSPGHSWCCRLIATLSQELVMNAPLLQPIAISSARNSRLRLFLVLTMLVLVGFAGVRAAPATPPAALVKEINPNPTAIWAEWARGLRPDGRRQSGFLQRRRSRKWPRAVGQRWHRRRYQARIRYRPRYGELMGPGDGRCSASD